MPSARPQKDAWCYLPLVVVAVGGEEGTVWEVWGAEGRIHLVTLVGTGSQGHSVRMQTA